MRRESSGAARGQAGFTLLELMIVVVIMSLAVTVTVVKLDGLTAKSRLAAAARKLGNTARYMRNQSMVLNLDYFMDFNLREHEWRLVEIPEGVPKTANIEEYSIEMDWNELPTGVRFEDIQFDTGMKYEDIKILVPFSPPTGLRWSFALHLINENGDRYTVMVNALTGSIDTISGYRDIPMISEDLIGQ